MSYFRVNQGEYTKTIYTWINDGMYKEAIGFLNEQLAINSNSRPALSLLAYCHYQLQEWDSAIQFYQQLIELFPQFSHYRLQLAQTLYQAALYDEALQATVELEDVSGLAAKKSHHQEKDGSSATSAAANVGFLLDFSVEDLDQRRWRLQAAIKYAQGELTAARSLLDRLDDSSADKAINLACLAYKEGRFEVALTKFQEAMQLDSGFKADLAYSIALCYYQRRQYPQALTHIGEIIERGIREHPELSVGSATEGIQVRSVGNTQKLQESFLIEAFNLKAAIEFKSDQLESARESLTDMPPRSEQELDAVTLHNQALINFDLDPAESFEKLQFLLQRHEGAFPPETFSNLLILYCRYEYYELAADLMAENTQFTYKYLTQYVYEFLDGLITAQTSPEEGYRKFDELLIRNGEMLRKLHKQLQECNKIGQQASDQQVTAGRELQTEIDQQMQLYIPLLMAQAKIYWDLENYEQVEKVFYKSVDFCSDHDTWKLNVAHTLFMQENKYEEATGFYEQLVKKNYEKILNVSAIVLANLCVSYIMLGQNQPAEDLMRKIEREEEQLLIADPDKRVYHLCIVNLVIGTLYCSKGNYEFGISRIIKSLEPYDKKLCTDTWFYAKRCFLALAEHLHKQVLLLRDSILEECVQFLRNCEQNGRSVKAMVETPLEVMDPMTSGRNTVTYESRLLRLLFMQLYART